MEIRISQWLDTSKIDTDECPTMFGIQVNKKDGTGWHHVSQNGEALFFETVYEAGKKMDELKDRLLQKAL